MLRILIDHLPELEGWEVHWLLAYLRFDAVYPGVGPGIALVMMQKQLKRYRQP